MIWPCATDPAVPAFNDAQTSVWPTDSTSESSSPLNQGEVFSSSGDAQHWNSTNYSVSPDVQPQPLNYNYPTRFHVDEQQYPYCNSWQYSPSLFPSTSNSCDYNNQNPCDYSTWSSYCYPQTPNLCNLQY